jgi:hypothetical protein
MRLTVAALVIVASVTAISVYSDVGEVATGHAVRTFRGAVSSAALNENADAGSGVTFDADSTTGAFLPKLAYTLFSPFPWQSGSLGLHIAKIEVFVWYYFFYRAVRAVRMLWRERRSDLLMFVSFIIPTTVAYAFSFANVGLIVRQRIVIVLATIVLASISWTAPDRVTDKMPDGRPKPALSPKSRRQAALGA